MVHDHCDEHEFYYGCQSCEPIWNKKTGDLVNRDEPLLEYFCSDKDKFNRCKFYFIKAIQIQSQLTDLTDLIYR